MRTGRAPDHHLECRPVEASRDSDAPSLVTVVGRHCKAGDVRAAEVLLLADVRSELPPLLHLTCEGFGQGADPGGLQ
ncbi:hypothetical protein ACVWXB_000942 [Streptomyces sp. TE12347]